jgi:outer membrane protein assembly factor BamA
MTAAGLLLLFLLAANGEGASPSTAETTPVTLPAPTPLAPPVSPPVLPKAGAATDPAVGPDSSADSGGPRVVSLRLALADPEPGELERLEAYLQDVMGSRAGPLLVAEVSRRLDLLGRYSAPLCRTESLDTDRVVLTCSVRRARVLRRVRFETNDVTNIDGVATGLPLAVLENELKKRILLRPGEPIDDDDTLGRGRIARQRSRIEDFLEREGYYGAQVIVDVGKPDQKGEVDVDVRVRGGSFVRVRRVNIKSFGPFSQQRLIDAFSSMCLSSDGFIDGVFIGNLKSCYNTRRLQSTIEKFDAELRKLGYPEGRVRVIPKFIDARASNDAEGCALNRNQIVELTRARLPIPPRCLDLTVEVVAGRNIVTRFHVEEGHELIKDQPIIGGTARWLRESFGEPSSRAWQLTFSNPVATASDTTLVEADMVERLTFDEAGSVDATEARLSEERILEYMDTRGYPAPSSDLVYQEYDDGSVAVDYYLKPGLAMPTRSLRFIGNATLSTEAILDGVELAVRPRTFSATGFVTMRDLDDDVVRLRSWYAQQGFAEADVSVHAARDGNGDVGVVFVIEEGDRFLLSDVVFAGGDPALTPSILRSIAHCRAGEKMLRDAKNPTGRACASSPLLPAELEADAHRVEAIYAGSGYPDAEAAVELGFGDQGPVVRISVFPFAATGEARTNPTMNNVKALRLGEIFVEGNLGTQRDVLLREMGLLEVVKGSRLNPDHIAQGVARLRRTALFSRVDVQLIGVDDHDDTAHVRITVEERPTSSVDLSLGFSTQQLFSLRLEGRDRNLFGSMFDGSASVDLGLFIGRFTQVKNQVRWPRMLGTDFSLSYTPLALTYNDAPAGVILQAPATGAAQKASAAWDQPDPRRRLFAASTSVALDWRASDIAPAIDDKLTVGIAVEASGDWLQVAGPYIEPLSLHALETVDGLTTLFSGDTAVDPASVIAFTPRLGFSSIDNPFDPKSGIGAEVFVRGVPFGLTPYAVVGVQGRSYVSFLNDRLTLASNVRVRAGVVAPYGACPDANERCEWALMQSQLLRIGGERTVRGVQENQVGTLGTLYGQDLSVPLDQDGNAIQGVRPGLFGAVANIELRFTLIRQLFLGDVKPAIFTDIGFSSDDFAFKPQGFNAFFGDTRYAASFGTGIRYVLPVGPLAFDVAWSPFDKQTSTLPLRYSLTLGYIF